MALAAAWVLEVSNPGSCPKDPELAFAKPAAFAFEKLVPYPKDPESAFAEAAAFVFEKLDPYPKDLESAFAEAGAFAFEKLGPYPPLDPALALADD